MSQQATMRRQWLLLQKLDRSRRGHTLTELHQFLEDENGPCSRRTVQRDVKMLRDDVGFRIRRDADDRYRLENSGVGAQPQLAMSTTEMVALLLAEESTRRAPMAGALQDVFSRTRAMMPEAQRQFVERLKPFIQTTPKPRVMMEDLHYRHVQEMSEAINQQRRVRMYYRSVRRGLCERVLDPYLLWQAHGVMYIVAHDHLTGEKRTFAIPRIVELTILDEVFEPDPTFDPTDLTRRGFGVFNDDTRKIQVEFHRDIAYLIEERLWHYTQRSEATPWGRLFTWHMAGTIELARWVAGYGGFARVMTPPALAEQVREIHESALRDTR
ncbi:MAG: WYL domain-containing transcriptional regulator [Myxococcota bacterium]